MRPIDMNLRLKFNFYLIPSLLIILGVFAFLGDRLLKENARLQVIDKANILMESASAVRNYTVKEVKPLLAVQQRRQFLPQTVPTYAAKVTLDKLSTRFPQFSYKDAVLNPTNPSNRPIDWEADIINVFKNGLIDSDTLIGSRDTDLGPFLYMAKPIVIKNEACLACHNTPAEAPKTLIDAYGGQNGFGWKLNEVQGAQIVTVPTSIPIERAQKIWWQMITGLAIGFLLLIILFNVIFSFLIVRPLRQVSLQTEKISLGQTSDDEFIQPKGKDEIATLSRAIIRLNRSVKGAMQLLDQSWSQSQPPASTPAPDQGPKTQIDPSPHTHNGTKYDNE